MPETTEHPPDTDLALFALGLAINDAQLDDLEAHLLACESCVLRTEALEARMSETAARLCELLEQEPQSQRAAST